jgi:diguanylate cyclase (GGDEF)-like protein
MPDGEQVVRSLALSFRSKVCIITLLIVLGSQAGSSAVVLYATNRSVEDTGNKQFDTSMSAYKTLVSNRSQLLKRNTQSLGRNPAFKDAIAKNDATRILNHLDQHADIIDADISILSDEVGNVIHSNQDLGNDLEPLALLAEENHSSFAINGSYYELFSVPVATSSTLRWASIGYRIDDSVANHLAELVGLDISVFASKNDGKSTTMIASSLPAKDRTTLDMTAQNISAQHSRAKNHIEKLREEYHAERLPFIEGVPNIFAVVQKNDVEFMAPYTGMRGSILHGASTSVLFAVVLALLLSKIATNDIGRLLIGARKIRVGNYGHEITVGSRDEFGELAEAMNAMRESISEREQRIRHQADYDSLTGLPNRRKALQIIDSEIRKGNHTGSSLVVMTMHFDRFRQIQSALGYEIGDEVLNQAVAKVRDVLDDSTTLSRLEGDQLLIIAPELDLKDGWKLAEQVSRAIGAGLNIKSINVTLEACIGFCVCPQHGRKANELLSHASAAKDDAQQARKSIGAYKNGREANNFRRLTILGDVRRAALENEFELFLQPKADIQTNKICGAEALLRWTHPELGNISPVEFIPLAESAGSMEVITDWVLCRGIAQAARLAEAGLPANIAINISASDVESGRLPDLIYHELSEHGMDPGCLTLEVTEEAMVRNIAYASKMLNEFRLMGIHTSMDDFGIGYSSLSQLQQLPLDELKIDRSFVTHLPESTHNSAIVKAIIDLAHDLGMQVVAEGVETNSALRWLQEHGCERAQGYYFSPPVPEGEYIEWLKRWEKLTHAQNNTDGSVTSLSRLLPDIVS